MINLKAYAKVNLSLYITGIRNDGYHLLDTVMQSVSLCDTVQIEKQDKREINVTCNNDTLCGQDNICHKAARLFFDAVQTDGGVDIHIEKRIPLAAGLGGGSADAAAVLKGLNMEYDFPLKDSQLYEIALKLGADVPFCINNGCARVKGIGEELIPINRTLPLYMLLIKKGEKPSTAFMYKEFDKKMEGISQKASAENTCVSLETNDYKGFLASLHNDFSLLWDYSRIEKALLNSGADAVSLSGSGPTVMGFFETKEKAEKGYKLLKEVYRDIFFVQGVCE